jgi:hypothetical protein
MLRNDPEYHRLKLGGHGAVGSASYWLGKEHLLVVVIAGYVEKYQRFGYADIQGLIVRKTRVHYIWGFGFAALAISSLLAILQTLRGQPLASLGTGAQVALVALLLLSAASIVLIIMNAVAGAGCICYLRTALQTFPLPQVRRWKKAQALVKELTPRIVAAQGTGTTTQGEGQEPTQLEGAG